MIGVDRLLHEGDTASFGVSGLVSGETYEWYAIARGALYDCTGAEPASTSDEQRSPIYSFTVGTLPKLQMSPDQPVCHKFCEQFTLRVDVKDAVNVTDFAFEIHYDAPLLEYISVTWGDFLGGTGYIDYQAAGLVRGHITPGAPATGNGWLLNLTFHANETLIWKDYPGWINRLEGRIWFHWANLSLSVGPDLRYEEGVSNQIEVNEVNYTYVPIQGDVNSDGEVGLFDLRTVSAYYNVIEGDPAWIEASQYDLNGDDIIDIFDFVKIARNYGFMYDC